MLHRATAVATAAAAVAMSAWVLHDGRAPAAVTSREQLCSLYHATSAALPLRSAQQQMTLRRLAAQLADAAASYPDHPAIDAAPAHSAAATIRDVLRVTYGTPRDLWVAMRPVAVECGDDPRVGSPSVDRLLGQY